MGYRRKRKKDELREQLGISQDHMALWLGVSRSLYSMYEARQRSLPTKALFKYVQLLEAWKKFQEAYTPVTPSATNGQPDDELLFKIRVVKHNIAKAQFALEKLDDRPDYLKTKAFFEDLQPKTTDSAEQFVCMFQIAQHEKERTHVDNERNRLNTELALLQKKLEVLEGKLANK